MTDLLHGRVYRTHPSHIEKDNYFLVVSNNRRNRTFKQVLAVRREWLRRRRSTGGLSTVDCATGKLKQFIEEHLHKDVIPGSGPLKRLRASDDVHTSRPRQPSRDRCLTDWPSPSLARVSAAQGTHLCMQPQSAVQDITTHLVAVKQRQHAQVLRAAHLTAANRPPLPDERFPQRFSCDSRRAARACKSCGRLR